MEAVKAGYTPAPLTPAYNMWQTEGNIWQNMRQLWNTLDHKLRVSCIETLLLSQLYFWIKDLHDINTECEFLPAGGFKGFWLLKFIASLYFTHCLLEGMSHCHRFECPNLKCHTFDCHRFECPFMSICLHVCPFLPNILWRCHPSQCCDRGGDCLGLSCLLPSPCLSVCLSVCAVNRSAPNSPPSFPNWLQLGRIEDDVRGIPPPGRPLIQNTFTTSNIADL